MGSVSMWSRGTAKRAGMETEGLLTLQEYSKGGASLQAGHLQETDTAHRLVQSPPFTGGETNLATQSALAKAMHTAGGRAASSTQS